MILRIKDVFEHNQQKPLSGRALFVPAEAVKTNKQQCLSTLPRTKTNEEISLLHQREIMIRGAGRGVVSGPEQWQDIVCPVLSAVLSLRGSFEAGPQPSNASREPGPKRSVETWERCREIARHEVKLVVDIEGNGKSSYISRYRGRIRRTYKLPRKKNEINQIARFYNTFETIAVSLRACFRQKSSILGVLHRAAWIVGH